MPIRVTDIANRVAKRTISFDGEPVNYTFRPGTVTPARLQLVQDNKDDLSVVAGLIKDALIEWDVIGSDGAMYPLETEALMVLPMEILNAISGDMFESISPPNSKRNGGRS